MPHTAAPVDLIDVPGSSGSNSSHAPQQQAPQPRVARGRYAKFNGGMDVLLLEALRGNNPFTAKHGTRLQMWQNIAQIVGEELFQNPEAYSWHTCRYARPSVNEQSRFQAF